MRAYDEESFGPLASIVVVDGTDEAIEVANDTEYGLSAAIWSADVPAALELAQRIQSGICHINDTTVQRRAADAVRRRQGERLGAFRRRAPRSTSSPSCAGSRSRRRSATTPSSASGPSAVAYERGPSEPPLAVEEEERAV